jgi:hypothetical protein
MIPAAAIKQSAPPTAAPITTLRFVLVESLLVLELRFTLRFVLVESLLVLELRFTELAWLDKVLVTAVQSSIHGQDASSTHTIASLNAQYRQANCSVEMAPSAPLTRPPSHPVEFNGFPSLKHIYILCQAISLNQHLSIY